MTRRFSERMGLRPPRQIQTDSMDNELRNSIWNYLLPVFESAPDPWAQTIARDLWKVPVDDVASSWDRLTAFTQPEPVVRFIRERFMRAQWYEVYDLLEFVVARGEGGSKASRTKGGPAYEANALLERELSSFRFVQGHLVRLSNRSEIESIEEAVSRSARSRLCGGPNRHQGETGSLNEISRSESAR